MIVTIPPRGRTPENVPTAAAARPGRTASAASAPMRPVDAALATFRARFDGLGRDEAGPRGFFLNLLL